MIPRARLYTGDSLPYITRQAGVYPFVFTSLPDAAETSMTLPRWVDWFTLGVMRCVESLAPGGVAVFYQTDRRADGALVSKADLVLRGIEAADRRVLWHKIAVRTHSVDLFRPGYSHIIAATNGARPGRATVDVFDAGRRDYPNAIGADAAARVFDALAHLDTPLVFDPFCGRGSILQAAAQRDMNVDGIDIDPEQIARTAERLMPFADVATGRV